MTKQVGLVTGNQFGYLYIDGVPYNPTKCKRFMTKGAGIKLQDIVIFEPEDDGKVLSYLKNALYAEGKEIAMVKHFVRANEMVRAKLSEFPGISDQIRKDLAEEGLVITNDGVFHTPLENDLPDKVPETRDLGIPQEVLDYITPGDLRQIGIMLQSSLKIVGDVNMINTPEGQKVDMAKIKQDALDLMRWVDDNSSQIIKKAEEYVAMQGSKK
jgi:hypothetical protein